MLIMDHWCKDAFSRTAKSTGEPQGEVKCSWFLRKLRNPGRQHSILLLETKELSLQLPTPPIIRPFPRLILTFAPQWAPHGTPTKTFLKSGQPFCHQEIKVQWRCFILLYVKKNTEYLNIFKAIFPLAKAGVFFRKGHYQHSEAFLLYTIAFCGLINLKSILKKGFPVSAYGKWDERFCCLANKRFVIIPMQTAHISWLILDDRTFWNIYFLSSQVQNEQAGHWQLVLFYTLISRDKHLRWAKKGERNDLTKPLWLLPFSSYRKVVSNAS